MLYICRYCSSLFPNQSLVAGNVQFAVKKKKKNCRKCPACKKASLCACAQLPAARVHEQGSARYRHHHHLHRCFCLTGLVSNDRRFREYGSIVFILVMMSFWCYLHNAISKSTASPSPSRSETVLLNVINTWLFRGGKVASEVNKNRPGQLKKKKKERKKKHTHNRPRHQYSGNRKLKKVVKWWVQQAKRGREHNC